MREDKKKDEAVLRGYEGAPVSPDVEAGESVTRCGQASSLFGRIAV
jgi:hypothetical protein